MIIEIQSSQGNFKGEKIREDNLFITLRLYINWRVYFPDFSRNYIDITIRKEFMDDFSAKKLDPNCKEKRECDQLCRKFQDCADDFLAREDVEREPRRERISKELNNIVEGIKDNE